MQKWIILCMCGLVILSGIMFMTKPSQDQYTDWLKETIIERMDGQSPMLRLGISLFGEQMIENHTEVKDFVVFNTFETEFRGKELKFVGVFHTFIPLTLGGS